MIRLKSITKVFRTEDTETFALDNVDLDVTPGEFVAVMGPSGCGKSTLLNIVGMIDTPTSGEYYFNGQEVSNRSEEQLVGVRKENLGFIFQNFNLIDTLTVYENIELPLLYKSLPKKQRKNQVREAMELVDLYPRAKHRPSQLSGGQQQRVAIARAVVTDPKLILADEPTGNLDSRNGGDVMETLKTLHEQGATVLMVTHSTAHGASADRIVHMLDGRIVDAPVYSQAV